VNRLPFTIRFEEGAFHAFAKLDKGIRGDVTKKLRQLERDDFVSRHLKHGVNVSVEEVGQYRIAFTIDEKEKIKYIVFIGKHKDYESWYWKF